MVTSLTFFLRLFISIIIGSVVFYSSTPLGTHLKFSQEQEISGLLPPSIAGQILSQPPLQVSKSRVDTFVINSFDHFSISMNKTHYWPSGPAITPYTFRLSRIRTQDIQLRGIVIDKTGSGTCTEQLNGDIYCSGVISSLTITYQINFVPTLIPPIISLNVGGFEDVATNYTCTLLYPATITFATANIPPNIHDLTQRTLTWSQSNMNNLNILVSFTDPQLKGVWLPVIRK